MPAVQPLAALSPGTSELWQQAGGAVHVCTGGVEALLKDAGHGPESQAFRFSTCRV